MPRYRLLIEYHGGPFQGWQKLPDVPTVQGTLEAAAAQLDGAPVEVFGAGDQLPLIYEHASTGSKGVLTQIQHDPVDPAVLQIPTGFRERQLDMPGG